MNERRCGSIQAAVRVALVAIGVSGSTVGGEPLAAQGPSQRFDFSADRVLVPFQAPKPGAKDEGTATILSIVIVGAGQMYAGDTKRGLLMLGGAYGAIIAGAIISTSASCSFTDSLDCTDGSTVPLAIGALAALGIWIYGIVDAAPTTRRMNKARGLAYGPISPTVLVGRGGQVGLGVKVGF